MAAFAERQRDEALRERLDRAIEGEAPPAGSAAPRVLRGRCSRGLIADNGIRAG
jgi:hypothetical protein